MRTWKDLQKLGGLAAIYEAVAYLFGIVGYMLVLDYSGVTDPIQKVALFQENQSFLYFLTFFVYVVFGFSLVLLSLALYKRLKLFSTAIMQTATVLGLIWAGLVIASGMIFNVGVAAVVSLFETNPTQAAIVWQSIEIVFEGLGGGNEIVGGLWALLVSWVALRAGKLSKALNYLGIVIGAAGILSAIPNLAEFTQAIFGLGQIIWFLWLGIIMLKTNEIIKTKIV